MSDLVPAADPIRTALDEARPNVDVIGDIDDLLVVARRDDVTLERFDLIEIEQRHAGRPLRQRDGLNVHGAAGFVAAVEARAECDVVNAPTVYVDAVDRVLTCVVNDASGDGPGHRDHRITFAPIKTEEWKHWVHHSGRMVDQAEFADIIETGESELLNPSAAVMLDLAQTFAANVSVRARSAHRIRDGQVQFAWEEDIEATAGADGTASIPQEFTIRARPFYGSAPVEARCRLRYRLRDGKLTLGYALVRPEDIERAAFESVVSEAIAGLADDDGIVSLPVIHGSA